MLPAWSQPYVFGLILSGLMSFLVSGVSLLGATGITPDFMAVWLRAWLSAWAVAFPAVLVVAPITRRLVARVVAAPK